MKVKQNIVPIVLLICIAVTGCGTYKTPGLENYSNDQLARLEVPDTPLLGYSIMVHSIDGKSRGFGLYDSYLLKPGKRIITVLGNTQSGLYQAPENLMFIAKAGKVYQLKFSVIDGTAMWDSRIIDKDTGNLVDFVKKETTCSYSTFGDVECDYSMN
jgi:hypothetical protein